MSDCFEEIGIVKDIAENMLLVSLPANTRCRACNICRTGQEKEMRLTTFGPGGFVIGERVKIKIEGRNLLMASFIVYMVPLIDMFIGYFLGWYLFNKLGNSEQAHPAGAVTAGLFFAMSFYLSRLLNKKMEREGRHIITIEKCPADGEQK